jgi:large subunit ribosomal protein L22
MKVIAKLNHLRIAPRKVRLVADLIRGKAVVEAQTILSFGDKKANSPMLKLLNQAMANAKNNFQADPLNFFIASLSVDEGPKSKRYQPRARGQAYEIQKKSSHIILTLEEIVKGAKKIVAEKKEAVKEEEKKEEIFKAESSKPKAKFKPEKEIELPKQRTEKSFNKIFRRKTS